METELLSPIDQAIRDMPATIAAAARAARRMETRRVVESYDPHVWRPKALLADTLDPVGRNAVCLATRDVILGALRRQIRFQGELVDKGYAPAVLTLRAARRAYIAERAPTCRFASRASAAIADAPALAVAGAR